MNETDIMQEYFPYALQIRRAVWERLSLTGVHRSIRDAGRPRINFLRELSARLAPTGCQVSSGELNLYALQMEIYRYLLRNYSQLQCPGIISRSLSASGLGYGSEPMETIARLFCKHFPGVPFLDEPALSPVEWLDLDDTSCARHTTVAAELLLLAVAGENRAADGFRDLFDDTELVAEAAYRSCVDGLERELESAPPVAEFGISLPELLRLPLIAAPDSLYAQVEYMKTHWQIILPPEVLTEIQRVFAVVHEEAKVFAPRGEPGGGAVLEFGEHLGSVGTNDFYPEPERFSPDTDWMPNVVLLAKMVYVWLGQLSLRYGEEIHRLDQIPDAELDRLARWGVTGLWLIGIWERSPASQRIKQLCGNPEAISSAYSLFDYTIATDLGGEDALWNLRERALKRGIRLASDMVPNHTGLYSRWTLEHPDWFVQLDYPPYPAYSFTGPDLSSSPDISLHIEDGYWERRDAAVVFKHYDHRSGRTRYIYHGNDGSSTPWNDTAQLDYLNPEVRETVIRTILHVARMFPIIRFDAAMTLAKKHYQRLWYPQPGHGGIPSRPEYGLTREQFDVAMPEEFWREVVDRVAGETPDTLLLAEAFWLMEGYFVRTLGMHRVYNSAFMNMLKMEENAKYRQTIRNVLEFNPQVLQRFVNFMNNPDEKTAVEQFGKENKYFGACVLLVTMPGLPMIGHGQVEGFHEKYGMEYRRAYWDEPVDEHLVREHERRIFPLMRRRWLFSGADSFVFYDFQTGNHVNEDVFAYTNRSGDQRALIVYHNRFAVTTGWIKESTSFAVKGESGEMELRRTSLGAALDIKGDGRHYYLFRDYGENLEYIRNGRELCEQGLFQKLEAYEYHVYLDFREIWDDEYGTWGKLCHQLDDRGVSSLEEEVKQIRFAGLIDLLRVHMEKSGPLLTGAYGEMAATDMATGRAVFAADQQALLLAVAGAAELTSIPEDILPALVRELTMLEQEAAVSGSMLANRTARLLAFAWLTLHRLGQLDAGPDTSAATVELVNRFGLTRPLEEEFYGEAVAGDDTLALLDVPSIMFLFAALLRWQDFFALSEEDQLAGLSGLLADHDVAGFIGRHESGGFEWFIRERWEIMIGALQLTAAISAYGQELPEEEYRLLVDAMLKSAELLKEMGAKAGYRIDQMTNRVMAADTALLSR